MMEEGDGLHPTTGPVLVESCLAASRYRFHPAAAPHCGSERGHRQCDRSSTGEKTMILGYDVFVVGLSRGQACAWRVRLGRVHYTWESKRVNGDMIIGREDSREARNVQHV